MPKTLQDSQKWLEISILPNLCRNIDFGEVSRERPELRKHYEHNDTTLNKNTCSMIMRDKTRKISSTSPNIFIRHIIMQQLVATVTGLELGPHPPQERISGHIIMWTIGVALSAWLVAQLMEMSANSNSEERKEEEGKLLIQDVQVQCDGNISLGEKCNKKHSSEHQECEQPVIHAILPDTKIEPPKAHTARAGNSQAYLKPRYDQPNKYCSE